MVSPREQLAAGLAIAAFAAGCASSPAPHPILRVPDPPAAPTVIAPSEPPPSPPPRAPEESHAAKLVRTIENVGLPPPSELEALDDDERTELAERVEALLASPPEMMPLRPALRALAIAWSSRAERVIVKELAHRDRAVRNVAREVLRAHRVSSTTIAAGLPANAAPEISAAFAEAISEAGGDAALVSRLCAPFPPGADPSAWEEDETRCRAARTRAGDKAARAALAQKVTAFAANGNYHAVKDRFAWMETELGARAPWRELAPLIRNTRTSPIVVCYYPIGTKVVGHEPPLGDAFLRAAVRANGLDVSFSLDANDITAAQRAEVERKLASIAR